MDVVKKKMIMERHVLLLFSSAFAEAFFQAKVSPNFLQTRPILSTQRRAVHLSLSKVSMKDGSNHFKRKDFLSMISTIALSAAIPAPANSFGSGQREIGEIAASGIIFKDTIKVTAFQDPKVEGVQLYVSDFQRPITERLQKDFFSDPSQASIGCARTGTVKISKDLYKGRDGEEVFEQARSLLFKTLRVRRVYDPETKSLVYVSYSTRFNKDDDDNKSRFKTTTCAVHVDEEELP